MMAKEASKETFGIPLLDIILFYVDAYLGEYVTAVFALVGRESYLRKT